MIEAAVAYGSNKKDIEPPPLLSLNYRCKQWNTLPKAGGLLDQDYLMIYRMGWCARAFEAARARKLFKMTPEHEQTILSLVKMGVI